MWWDERNCARPPVYTRRDGLRLGAAWAAGAWLPGTAATTAGEAHFRGCGLPLSSVGVVAQAVDALVPLVSLNPEKPFQLASTAKLVTSMAALELLGPQFRWRTMAFARGPLLQGKLLGDLWIVGGGNATLSSHDLAGWMVSWRAQGLTDILGDIVLDRFAYQLTERDHDHTPLPAPDRPHHARPDALTVDEGRLKVTLSPSHSGRPAVQLEPPLAGVRVDQGRAATSGCNAWARWSDTASAEPRISVQGTLAAGCAPREWVLAPLPHTEFSTRAVAGLWREVGGKLRGRVIDKSRPDREALLPLGPDGEPQMPFATHLSAPLPQLLRDINKSSDNLAARNLMLALSKGFPYKAATLPAAQARMREWLARQGVGPEDMQIENGSGLSRGERAKPRAFVQLLAKAWAARQAGSLVDSLPVAGVDGTLEHRMRSGAATGQAHLKTGTLLDTRALAGYVHSRRGRVYAVAALVNHPDAGRATPAMDHFIEWLAREG